MRSEDEIVRAHDLLVGVLMGEVPVELDEQNRQLMAAATDALCWVLGHSHNITFGENLAQVETAALLAGYVLTKE